MMQQKPEVTGGEPKGKLSLENSDWLKRLHRQMHKQTEMKRQDIVRRGIKEEAGETKMKNLTQWREQGGLKLKEDGTLSESNQKRKTRTPIKKEPNKWVKVWIAAI